MKLLKRLSIGLVVLLVLVIGGGILFVDSLAGKAVEQGATYALGVPTTLDSAGIGLFSGHSSLNGLTVANPPGCAQPNFLTVRQVRLDLPLSTLLEPRITIPALEIEGIAIALERNEQGTNYGRILDNLKRFESGEVPEEKAEGPGMEFLLQRIVIRDVQAVADVLPGGGELTKLRISIPEIVLEDLKSQMTAAEICAFVMKAVLRATLDEGAGVLPEELLRDLRGRLDTLKDEAAARVGAKLQEELTEVLGDQAAKDAAAKIGSKLDGLLKGKDKK